MKLLYYTKKIEVLESSDITDFDEFLELIDQVSTEAVFNNDCTSIEMPREDFIEVINNVSSAEHQLLPNMSNNELYHQLMNILNSTNNKVKFTDNSKIYLKWE